MIDKLVHFSHKFCYRIYDVSFLQPYCTCLVGLTNSICLPVIGDCCLSKSNVAHDELCKTLLLSLLS